MYGFQLNTRRYSFARGEFPEYETWIDILSAMSWENAGEPLPPSAGDFIDSVKPLASSAIAILENG
jgi:hypothetical protein